MRPRDVAGCVRWPDVTAVTWTFGGPTSYVLQPPSPSLTSIKATPVQSRTHLRRSAAVTAASGLILAGMLGVSPALAADFTLDSTADTVDADPGDGTCADAAGACTLRAAVMEANALAGADTINVGAVAYPLTIAGADEEAAATGDLDITDDLTIIGADAATSSVDGGALDRIFDILDGDVVIQNLTLTNGAVTAEGAKGGAIQVVVGTLTLSDSILTSSEAALAGGGLEVTATTATLSDVDFSDNTAGANGGAIHLTGDATATITDGTVTGNTADGEGGGFWNGSGTMSVNGTTFTTNVGAGDSVLDADPNDIKGGGALFNNGGTLNVTDATITAGTATGAGGSGGGILNDNGALTVTGTTITTSTAVRAGGGIESFGGDATNTLSNVTFTDNTANVNGGAVHVTGAGTTTVTGGDVSDNTAAAEGGGFWNGSGQMTVTNTTFSGNVANGDSVLDVEPNDIRGGGSLFNNGGTLMVNGAAITTSTAPGAGGSGGGVLNDNGALVLTDTTISTSSATRAGGAVESFGGEATNTIATVTFDDNMAGVNGGGMHVTGAGTTTIADSSVTGNTAGGEGGGLWNSAVGDFSIVRVLIADNTASGTDTEQGGGGLFNDGGTLNVVNSTVTGNMAVTLGSGIADVGGTTMLVHVTVADNTGTDAAVATGAAGAITATNTILASTGTVCAGAVTSGGGNIGTDTSCSLSGASDKPSTDPQLAALADNGGPTQTRAIAAGSPAIDGGLPASCEALDQRSASRGAACDVGAFELGAAAPAPNPSATPTPAPAPSASPTPAPTTPTPTPAPTGGLPSTGGGLGLLGLALAGAAATRRRKD